MKTSNTFKAPSEAFVWIWRPEQTTPIVTGRLHAKNSVISFQYCSSYLYQENPPPLEIHALEIHALEPPPEKGADPSWHWTSNPWRDSGLLPRSMGASRYYVQNSSKKR